MRNIKYTKTIKLILITIFSAFIISCGGSKGDSKFTFNALLYPAVEKSNCIIYDKDNNKLANGTTDKKSNIILDKEFNYKGIIRINCKNGNYVNQALSKQGQDHYTNLKELNAVVDFKKGQQFMVTALTDIAYQIEPNNLEAVVNTHNKKVASEFGLEDITTIKPINIYTDKPENNQETAYATLLVALLKYAKIDKNDLSDVAQKIAKIVKDNDNKLKKSFFISLEDALDKYYTGEARDNNFKSIKKLRIYDLLDNKIESFSIDDIVDPAKFGGEHPIQHYYGNAMGSGFGNYKRGSFHYGPLQYNVESKHQMWPNFSVFLLKNHEDNNKPVYKVQVISNYGANYGADDIKKSGNLVIRYAEASKNAAIKILEVDASDSNYARKINLDTGTVITNSDDWHMSYQKYKGFATNSGEASIYSNGIQACLAYEFEKLYKDNQPVVSEFRNINKENTLAEFNDVTQDSCTDFVKDGVISRFSNWYIVDNDGKVIIKKGKNNDWIIEGRSESNPTIYIRVKINKFTKDKLVFGYQIWNEGKWGEEKLSEEIDWRKNKKIWWDIDLNKTTPHKVRSGNTWDIVIENDDSSDYPKILVAQRVAIIK